MRSRLFSAITFFVIVALVVVDLARQRREAPPFVPAVPAAPSVGPDLLDRPPAPMERNLAPRKSSAPSDLAPPDPVPSEPKRHAPGVPNPARSPTRPPSLVSPPPPAVWPGCLCGLPPFHKWGCMRGGIL